MRSPNYQQKKLAAIHFNDEPTMTDQSAAEDTDINVIVNQFMRTGQLTAGATPPTQGDFTQIPTNLRDMIELGRSVRFHRNRLPKQLQGMTDHELLALTPDALRKILTDEPAPKPAEKKEANE